MAELGTLRFNYKGNWRSGVAYKRHDIVFFNGAFCWCSTAHTSSSSNEPTDQLLMGTHAALQSESTNWGLWSNGFSAGSDRFPERGSSANINFATGAYSIRYNGAYFGGTGGTGWFDSGSITYLNGQFMTTGTGVFLQKNASTATVSGAYTAAGSQYAGYYVTKDNADNRNALSPFGFSKYRVAKRGLVNRGRTDLGYKNGTLETSNVDHHHPVKITDAVYTGYGMHFINRRGGCIFHGGSSNYSGAFAGTNTNCNDGHVVEMPFHHMEWIEGGLPTPDGRPPRAIQWEKSYQGNLVLFNNGEVHYWGYGGHGQPGIGDNSSTSNSGPVRCGYGNINRTGATTVLRNKRAIKIALSTGTNDDTALSCYALIDNGNGTNTLYSWGYNGYGQLGTGNTTNYNVPQALSISTTGKIIDVWATGGNYGSVYIYTSSGYMYSCGYNGYGQLGRGSTTNQSTFGLVKNWGTNGIRQFSLNGRQYTSCAVVTTGGQLWTWGRNNVYQLGFGTTTDVTSPTRVSTWTDVRAAWMSGHQNNQYLIVTRGTSQVNNTAYFVGRNAYHMAGDAGNNSNRTGFVTMTRTLWGNEGQSTGNMTNVCSFRRTFGNSNGTEMGVFLGRYVGTRSTYSQEYIEEDNTINGTTAETSYWFASAARQSGDGIDYRDYMVEWYYQGYMNHGIGLGLSQDRNDYQSNIPPNHNEADGNSRRYHANIRYPLGINKYKLDYHDGGYNTTNSSTWVDTISGQVFIAGYHSQGLTPHGQEVDPWVSTIQPPRGF